MLNSKILIVGAGAAGIAAASKLMENNIHNFKILEAENRVGGRIFTSSVDGKTVEIGAQWVHGKENNVVHKLGTEANLLSENSYDVTKSKCIMSCGSFVDDHLAAQLYCLFKEILNDDDKLVKFSGSLGDYFKDNSQLLGGKIHIDDYILESFIEWFHRFQNSIDGSDSWFETSARGTLDYHECEGNLLTIWKDGGYCKIFDLLMGVNDKMIKERIVFNKTVKRIFWDQKPLKVICTDGSTFTTDHVLLTISLGVLKEGHESFFVPALPYKKVGAIKDLGFGTVNKIFLKFPFRWWPLDCPGFNLLYTRKDAPSFQGNLSWLNEVFSFFSVDNNPLVLCGWVVGSAARNMESCTNQEIQQGCHQLLVNFLGQHYKIPFPDSLLRSEWHTNSHFRGSYSFRTVKSEYSNVKAADLASPLYLSPGNPVILFAGEATHNNFYSTVHGAIETGWREADRLKKYLNVTQTTRLHGSMSSDLNFFKVPVVIIGAGMAGLGAAKTLVDAGISTFVLLEAQDYIGGRVCSVAVDLDYPNHSTYIELGAQWIHGKNNPLFTLAEAEGLLSNLVSVEGEGLFLMPNGDEVPHTIVQEVAQVVEDILEGCGQFMNKSDDDNIGSIGDILSEKFSYYLNSCNDATHVRKMKEDLFDWHKRFQVIDNSCDELRCLSAKSWGLYQYNGGNNYNNFKAGYSSLVEYLTRDLPKKSLKISTEVKHINLVPDQPEVKVFCEDGSIYLTEHVIVTSSLGYLKENHHTLFNPPLPFDMVKTINLMGFDTINKIFLVYKYNWWPEGIKGIQLVWDSAEKEDFYHQSWLRHLSGFDVLDNLTGVLLGWIGGEGARIMETLTDDEVSNDCTTVIRRFFNRPLIPLPTNIFRSKWHNNKFIRGGYSHITKQCDQEDCGSNNLSQPVYVEIPGSYNQKHPAIVLAGEAVHKNYFSTTHGAYLSGVTQAQKIIDYRIKSYYE